YFFSSKRRHTICYRDWSSDVCSSDLVQRNLQDRAAGLLKGGTAPTRESVERKCQQILHRQHLRQLVQTTVILNAAAVPQLSYQSDPPAQEKLRDTYLGKTLLIT